MESTLTHKPAAGLATTAYLVYDAALCPITPNSNGPGRLELAEEIALNAANGISTALARTALSQDTGRNFVVKTLDLRDFEKTVAKTNIAIIRALFFLLCPVIHKARRNEFTGLGGKYRLEDWATFYNGQPRKFDPKHRDMIRTRMVHMETELSKIGDAVSSQQNRVFYLAVSMLDWIDDTSRHSAILALRDRTYEEHRHVVRKRNSYFLSRCIEDAVASRPTDGSTLYPLASDQAHLSTLELRLRPPQKQLVDDVADQYAGENARIVVQHSIPAINGVYYDRDIRDHARKWSAKIEIKDTHICRLVNMNFNNGWLDDEIINNYLTLLETWSENRRAYNVDPPHPKVLFRNAQWWPRFKVNGTQTLAYKNVTFGEDGAIALPTRVTSSWFIEAMWTYDIIVIPINVNNNHWISASIIKYAHEPGPSDAASISANVDDATAQLETYYYAIAVNDSLSRGPYNPEYLCHNLARALRQTHSALNEMRRRAHQLPDRRVYIHIVYIINGELHTEARTGAYITNSSEEASFIRASEETEQQVVQKCNGTANGSAGSTMGGKMVLNLLDSSNPEQMNESDCGVFMLMCMEHTCMLKKLEYTSEKMRDIRYNIAYQLLSGTKLPSLQSTYNPHRALPALVTELSSSVRSNFIAKLRNGKLHTVISTIGNGVVLERIPPRGYSLIANRDFPNGSIVTFYDTDKDWISNGEAKKLCRMTKHGGTHFKSVRPGCDNVIVGIRLSSDDEKKDINPNTKFKGRGAGSFINSATWQVDGQIKKQRSVNAKFEVINSDKEPHDSPKTTICAVRATTDIRKGDEIFVDYESGYHRINDTGIAVRTPEKHPTSNGGTDVPDASRSSSDTDDDTTTERGKAPKTRQRGPVKSTSQKPIDVLKQQLKAGKVSASVEVRMAGDAVGKGVFAKVDIPSGTFICGYEGEYLRGRRAIDERRKLIQKNPHQYLVESSTLDRNQLWAISADNPVYMQRKHPDAIGHLMNHSRGSDNVSLKPVKFKNDSPPFRIAMIAKKRIKANTELTWDYGDRTHDGMQANPWLKRNDKARDDKGKKPALRAPVAASERSAPRRSMRVPRQQREPRPEVLDILTRLAQDDPQILETLDKARNTNPQLYRFSVHGKPLHKSDGLYISEWREVANMLRTNTTLGMLFLEGSGLEQDKHIVEAISASMTENTTVYCINMGETEFDDTMLDTLADMYEQNEHLTNYYLDGLISAKDGGMRIRAAAAQNYEAYEQQHPEAESDPRRQRDRDKAAPVEKTARSRASLLSTTI